MLFIVPVSDWQERVKEFCFNLAENGLWLFMLWCLSCTALTLPEDCRYNGQRNCNCPQLHLPEKTHKADCFLQQSRFCLTVEFHFMQTQLTFQLFPLDTYAFCFCGRSTECASNPWGAVHSFVRHHHRSLDVGRWVHRGVVWTSVRHLHQPVQRRQ